MLSLTAMSPPENKKKKKALPPLSFSSLPEDITLNYLARVSRSYYPTLSILSRSFRSLISSSELYKERSHLNTTEHCLYVCLSDLNSSHSPKWFTLWINPNGALRNMRRKIVQIPHSHLASVTKSTVVVGSEIYVMGGQEPSSSAVRILDCRTHTWREAPSMKVSRGYASACAYNGKIYVLGGCKEVEDWGEVFDTQTQTWECLPEPGNEIRNMKICRIMEFKGNIKFGNSMINAYNTKQGTWECCDNKSATYPRGECVVDNVFYSVHNTNSSPIVIYWYNIEGGNWKEVKGLNYLGDRYNTRCSRSKLVSCGEKLLLIWEEPMNRFEPKKIVCAKIKVEKYDGSRGVLGFVEWVNVVHNISSSCDLVDCLLVSI